MWSYETDKLTASQCSSEALFSGCIILRWIVGTVWDPACTRGSLEAYTFGPGLLFFVWSSSWN